MLMAAVLADRLLNLLAELALDTCERLTVASL